MKKAIVSLLAKLRSIAVLIIAVYPGLGLCRGIRQSPRAETVAPKTGAKRPVTVLDGIEMVQPGEAHFQGALSSKHEIAHFSPDGKSFVIVLKHGKFRENTNEYSIMYFVAKEDGSGKTGLVLAKLSSSSNRPAIERVEWLNNHLIAFLGENPGENPQLYTVDTNTRRLTKITNSQDGLTSYTWNQKTDEIVFLAAKPAAPLIRSDEERHGVIVDSQSLPDLFRGRDMTAQLFLSDLYIQKGISGQPERIKVDGEVGSGSILYMSGDGKHLIVRMMVTAKPPELWRGYQDKELQNQLNTPHTAGTPAVIYQFQIVDLESKLVRPLLNSPIPVEDYPDVVWSPDSKSVALSGVLLPLDSTNLIGDEIRRRTKFVAEVSIESGSVTPIAEGAVRLQSWDRATGRLLGNTGTWGGADWQEDGQPIAYEKQDGVWKITDAQKEGANVSRTLDVTLREDMNTPPEIFAEDARAGEKTLLLDMNPKFKNLKFGEVRDLGVISGNGVSVKAGIYLPVGYQPGVRYPLVIQTHEWSPERFWIDGPFSSAFAAQALAGRGFIVAQVALNRNRNESSTLKEVLDEVKDYELVINYLDKRRMVDLNRIGIIGFSRSGLGVKYALTHSRFHFAAATIADGSDVGYFRYITYINSTPWQTKDAEGVNGGIPVGAGIQSWLGNGLDFGLEKVSTPVRLEANDPESLFFSWEYFGILRRLEKPVDLIYMPGGAHVLIKPWDRMTSQQGNVDWFCFWLQGYEDADPTKAAQYKRWEHLRELQDAEDKVDGQPNTAKPN